MTRARSCIREDPRFRVFCSPAENQNLSQGELADAVGIGVGSAHYALRALIDAGMVKLGNFSAADGQTARQDLS